MPKDKAGNQLTWKEFFSRWKQGIEGITPYQQAKMSYANNWIMIIGFIFGIIVCIIGIKTLWWLLIILIAGLINSLIVQLGSYQRYSILRRIEEQINKINELESNKLQE